MTNTTNPREPELVHGTQPSHSPPHPLKTTRVSITHTHTHTSFLAATPNIHRALPLAESTPEARLLFGVLRDPSRVRAQPATRGRRKADHSGRSFASRGGFPAAPRAPSPRNAVSFPRRYAQLPHRQSHRPQQQRTTVKSQSAGDPRRPRGPIQLPVSALAACPV